MSDIEFPPVIDGHNDTLLNLHLLERGNGRSFFTKSDRGHLDLPRAQEGGLAGGFFAMFTPNPRKGDPAKDPTADLAPGASYYIPLPEAIEQSYALNFVNALISRLFKLVDESDGAVRIVHTVDELQTCLDDGTLAVIMHIEGAEAIDEDLNALYVLHAAGLRSLGPVWSRPTIFADGVPFAYPEGPDIGDGLTDAGRRLIKTCNQLGIMIDLSHMNEKGFWDVQKLTDAPLVATHSNAHALCASPRNLTDRQLDAIAESGGVIGLNYHVGFLCEDGSGYEETSLREIVRHGRYIADRIGIDHLALGSDFDGAKMPYDLKDVAGMPKLLQAFLDNGFSRGELEKLAYKNWLRVLRDTWTKRE